MLRITIWLGKSLKGLAKVNWPNKTQLDLQKRFQFLFMLIELDKLNCFLCRECFVIVGFYWLCNLSNFLYHLRCKKNAKLNVCPLKQINNVLAHHAYSPNGAFFDKFISYVCTYNMYSTYRMKLNRAIKKATQKHQINFFFCDWDIVFCRVIVKHLSLY